MISKSLTHELGLTQWRIIVIGNVKETSFKHQNHSILSKTNSASFQRWTNTILQNIGH